MHESFEPCLNPFQHTPLPILLSHSLVQSGLVPNLVASTSLPFRSTYSITEIRGAEPYCWKGAVFLFHATREQTTISQWVNGFMINLESQAKSFVVLAVWKKRYNAASIKQRSKRVTTTAYREKRRSNCSVEWSQSISSPSRAHGVANAPSDRPATTHRDKRQWGKNPPAQWETRQTNKHLRFKWVNGETNNKNKNL